MVSDFEQKENRKFFNKSLLYRTMGVVFLVAIVVLVVADIKIYQKKKKLVAKIDVYEKQIENIKKSSQTLRDEIANADNVDYLEKLGYEQFGRVRPGEKEYMFIEPEQKAYVSQEKNSFWGAGWLSGVWQWIKNIF
jgi:cell division protein FtsB